MTKFWRYLRIIFSASCGLACVLLIALWVRSYRQMDWLAYRSPANYVRVNCCRGSGSFYWTKTDPQSVNAIPPLPLGWIRQTHLLPTDDVRKWQWMWYSTHVSLAVRLWVLTILIVSLSAAPWLPWWSGRFTLRTVLIATTLIAVVLGVIVWASAHY